MASKKNKNSSQDDEYDEQIYIRTRDVPIYILRNRMNNMSLSPEERREARRKLVLKMGAKMPRVRPLNYAVYQENKRQEKASEASGLRDDKTKEKIHERMSGFGLLDKFYRRQAERQEKRGKKIVKVGKNKLPKRFARKFNKNKESKM